MTILKEGLWNRQGNYNKLKIFQMKKTKWMRNLLKSELLKVKKPY